MKVLRANIRRRGRMLILLMPFVLLVRDLNMHVHVVLCTCIMCSSLVLTTAGLTEVVLRSNFPLRRFRSSRRTP